MNCPAEVEQISFGRIADSGPGRDFASECAFAEQGMSGQVVSQWAFDQQDRSNSNQEFDLLPVTHADA